MAVTLADFRAYALARGNSAPTDAANADAEAALVRGGDYVRDEYVQRFKAEHLDPLPDEVDAATYEAAIVELATPNFFTSTYTEADAKVLTQVGEISWDFTGIKGGNKTPTSTKVAAMMRPFIAGNSKVLLRS